MTISNHITLADIHRMPVGQIAALPADQLAMLKDAADQQLTQAKTVADWLDGAISLKYADRAAECRAEAGKNAGTIRFDDGDFTVVADLPKRVDWDQDKLAAMVAQIRKAGDNPAQYVDIAIKVPERKYAAWPDNIREQFEPARTVRSGALKVEIVPQEGDQ